MPIVAAIAAAPLASATIGAAAIGAGASLSAASKAKSASQYATDQSIAQQDRATQIAQQNTAVVRERGDQAINAYADRLGLGQSGAPAISGLPAGQQADWAKVLAERPDVAAAVNDPNGGFNGATPEERAADWYTRYGQASGYQLPTTAATPNPNELTLSPAANVQQQTAAYASRPTALTAPAAYTPQTYTAPTFERPEFTDTLDVSYDDYMNSAEARAADWESGQQSGAAASALAASGALKSGAAAKALQDVQQANKIKWYQDFRNYSTNQYNTNRARADANFNFDASLRSDLAKYYDGLNNSNSLAQASFARDDYRFAQNRADNLFNTDRAYATDLALGERAYETGRWDAKNANMLALAGLGQGAAANYTGAVQTGASNNANALFSQAANTGNAAIAGASNINSLLGSGINALSYYYANQKKAA